MRSYFQTSLSLLIPVVIYPLIPIFIIFGIFLLEINRTIAILGNHKAVATIIDNPVNGKIDAETRYKIENGDFLFLDGETIVMLNKYYLKYEYTSKNKQYTDSIMVREALEQGVPVFHSDATKTFPLFAYKSFNATESFVYESGGKQWLYNEFKQWGFFLVIALLYSMIIFRKKYREYLGKRAKRKLDENLFIEKLIVSRQFGYLETELYLLDYIRNHHALNRFVAKYAKIKKDDSFYVEYVLGIISGYNRQEQLLKNVNKNDMNSFVSVFEENIKTYNQTNFRYF